MHVNLDLEWKHQETNKAYKYARASRWPTLENLWVVP